MNPKDHQRTFNGRVRILREGHENELPGHDQHFSTIKPTTTPPFSSIGVKKPIRHVLPVFLFITKRTTPAAPAPMTRTVFRSSRYFQQSSDQNPEKHLQGFRVVDWALNQSQNPETNNYIDRSLSVPSLGFVSENLQGTNLQPCNSQPLKIGGKGRSRHFPCQQKAYIYRGELGLTSREYIYTLNFQ